MKFTNFPFNFILFNKNITDTECFIIIWWLLE